MNSIKKLFTLAMLMIGISAFADVKVQINPNVLNPGEQGTISVILDNTVAVKNFQTTVVLPEGIKPVLDDGDIDYIQVGRISKTSNWSSSVTTTKSGNILVMVYSPKGKLIEAGNKAIMEIEVEATEDYAGDPISTSETVLKAADGVELGEITEAPAELPIEANIEISAAGYATYYAPFTVDLNKTEIEAYIVSGIDENDMLVMEKIEDGVIPAFQPVVLKGSACVLPMSGEEEDYIEPKGILEGVDEEGPATIGNYVLQSQNGVVGFYQVTEELQPNVKAYRATLVVPNDKAKVKAFTFGGVATSINAVAASNNAATTYDLLGRKAANAQKGIFIVNGKKVIK